MLASRRVTHDMMKTEDPLAPARQTVHTSFRFATELFKVCVFYTIRPMANQSNG